MTGLLTGSWLAGIKVIFHKEPNSDMSHAMTGCLPVSNTPHLGLQGSCLLYCTIHWASTLLDWTAGFYCTLLDSKFLLNSTGQQVSTVLYCTLLNSKFLATRKSVSQSYTGTGPGWARISSMKVHWTGWKSVFGNFFLSPKQQLGNGIDILSSSPFSF